MYTRLNQESRIAVTQAIDEAHQLGHTEVGPDHVLLGLLANLRGSTYRTLTAHGLTFDAAREVVISQRAEAAESAESAESDTTAAEATEAATPQPEHADATLEEDRAALRAIGIDLDRVREAVRSTFGADITEGWGERRGRGRRGRGDRGPRGDRARGEGRRGHHHRHDDQGHEPQEGHEGRGRGRGRRGPRSRRGDGGFSSSLRDVFGAVRRSTLRDALDEESFNERRAPRMSAPRLLLAIIDSPDAYARAVLASADTGALRSDVEAAIEAEHAEGRATTA